MLKRFGVLAMAFAIALPLASQSADARIRCDGRYQVQSDGSRIATPYCEDLYLARVAIQSYGVSTSARAIRNSVSEKERVCRFVGHDSRVADICMEFRNERGDRFRN